MSKDDRKRKINNVYNRNTLSEKAIEQYLVKSVESVGGLCLKYSNQSVTGYPDRVLLLPDGRTVWAELKSKGGKPSKVQQVRFQNMQDIGHPVYIIDSKPGVDKLMQKLGYEV